MIIRGRQATPLDVAPPVPTIVETLKAFLEALRHDEAPPIHIIDGLQAVEIAEACYDSATSGQAVEIYDEDEDVESEDDDLDGWKRWDDDED
jgi:predicted dehydrogenase